MNNLALVTILLTSFALNSFGQTTSSIENEIRRLDLAAARAILNKDEKLIARYFTPDSITNNPRNTQTRGSQGVIEAARTNLIDYLSFDRAIESVQVLGKTVIVMGSETIVMKSPTGEAGETIHRRYTNVWMKTGRQWRIVARHASIICSP